jgi:hypothetical protein
MHADHGILRRHVLGLAVAFSGLALAGDVPSVLAQATGSGPVTLDVRHLDLHTLIAPETPLTRIAGGLGVYRRAGVAREHLIVQ